MRQSREQDNIRDPQSPKSGVFVQSWQFNRETLGAQVRPGAGVELGGEGQSLNRDGDWAAPAPCVHCDGRDETCHLPFSSLHWTDEVRICRLDLQFTLEENEKYFKPAVTLCFMQEAKDWNIDAEHGRPRNHRRSSGLPSEALLGSRPHDTPYPKVRCVWMPVLIRCLCGVFCPPWISFL